jgi:hypothetical protein
MLVPSIILKRSFDIYISVSCILKRSFDKSTSTPLIFWNDHSTILVPGAHFASYHSTMCIFPWSLLLSIGWNTAKNFCFFGLPTFYIWRWIGHLKMLLSFPPDDSTCQAKNKILDRWIANTMHFLCWSINDYRQNRADNFIMTDHMYVKCTIHDTSTIVETNS